MPGHRIAKERFSNQQLHKKYTCLSCDLLLRDAVQSAMCGHWFCESCISLLLKTRNPVCPNCQESLKSDEDAEGSPGYFPDKFVRRDIDALEMTCVYAPEGCDWQGTFGKLESHLTGCEYSVCRTCHQRLNTVPSEHKCTLAHQEAFYCPLVKVGCVDTKFESKDILLTHMKESELKHNELLVASITKLSESNSRNSGSVVSNRSPHYPEVVVADGGYNMESGYYGSNSGHFGVDVVERDNVVKKSPPQFSGRKSPHTIGTLGPSASPAASGLHGEDVVTKLKQEMDRQLKIKDEEISSLRTMVNKLERTQRSKNADFEDRDFRLSLIENSNYDGTMVWKIPQFNQRMTDAQSGKYTSIFSLPFYTGRYGYKMCLRLYILGDGIGKGSYMSLFFVLMKGEFDNILKWPFTHKVTFKLINQGSGRDVSDTFQPDPMSTSFRKPRSDMNIASGCPRFVSHEDLKTGGFIVDDTVFIKCMVDVNTIMHP